MSETSAKKKPNEDEWGFEDSSSGFSKEAKIGFTVIAILLGVLGYFGYQKFGGGTEPETEKVASTEETKENPNEPQNNEPSKLPDENRNSNPFGDNSENSQQEPATVSFDDNPNNTGTVQLSSNNESPASNPFAGNDTNENSNNGTAGQNANSGNPFGSNGASIEQTDKKNKPIDGIDTSRYEYPSEDNIAYEKKQAQKENTKTDEWDNFSKLVNENNERNVQNIDTTTAGFETGSASEQSAQNNNSNSNNRNTQGSEFRTNNTVTRDSGYDSGFNSTGQNSSGIGSTMQNADRRNSDSRFGGYRPANSAQNSTQNSTQNFRSDRFQTGSSNFSSSNQSANKYNGDDSNFSNRYGNRQTQSYAPKPLPNDRPQYHKIASGDNYWNLSKKYYQAGRYFRALEEYNKYRISDPKKMRKGMVVLIPTEEILNQRFSKYISGGSKTTNNNSNASAGYFRGTNDQPMYRTGKNDVLTEIAQKHLGRSSRWIQIYEMNRHILKNPNNLKIGIELRLPSDASNVRIVQDFREIR